MNSRCLYLDKYLNLLKPSYKIETGFMQELRVQQAVLEHLVQCEMCRTTILTNHGITQTSFSEGDLKETLCSKTVVSQEMNQ